MFRHYNCAFICLHCGSSGVFKMVRCKQHRHTYMFRHYNCAFICFHCCSSGVFEMVRCKQHRHTYMFRHYNCAFICFHCCSSGVFKMVRCKQHRQTCSGTTIVPSFVFTAVQVVFSKWYAVSSTVTHWLTYRNFNQYKWGEKNTEF